MNALSAILREAEGHRLYFWCPGCNSAHAVVVPPAVSPWTWNGAVDKPTFTPSIKVTSGHYMPEYKAGDPCWCTFNQDHPDSPSDFKCGCCHSYVKDGQIQFLADCSHAMAGQTVPLPPWPLPDE